MAHVLLGTLEEISFWKTDSQIPGDVAESLLVAADYFKKLSACC